MEGSGLRVFLPPLWAVVSPLVLYEGPQTGGGVPSGQRLSVDYLPQRPPSSRALPGPTGTRLAGDSGPARALGVYNPHQEISPRPDTTCDLLGVRRGLSGTYSEPTRAKDGEHSQGTSTDVVATIDLAPSGGPVGGTFELLDSGHLSGATTLQGATTPQSISPAQGPPVFRSGSPDRRSLYGNVLVALVEFVCPFSRNLDTPAFRM